MIQPVFMLELNHKIIPGVVTVGKYDGEHSCLTAATTADKVIIHNPHRQHTVRWGRVAWSDAHADVAVLNMSQAVTALAAGALHPQHQRDVLLVGSPTMILAYDVQENSDMFLKDAPSGVSKIIVGKFGKLNQPLAVVGGRCCVQGLDHQGGEVFWSVVGDDVTAMALLDYDRDGTNELLIGSSDFTIRVLKESQVMSELSETEAVTGLAILQEGRFAYGLSNGTVGVYEETIRLWRVKSKNTPVEVQSYDLVGSGSEQVLTGWSSGKLDSRDLKTGEVLFKDSLPNAVAGLVRADYRGRGKDDLICVSVEGEVRGYATCSDGGLSSTGAGLDLTQSQDAAGELFARKQALLTELKHYQSNARYNEQRDGRAGSPSGQTPDMGVIPANTRLQIGLATTQSHVEVAVSTNNFTIIKVVMIFAEGIFNGETLIEHPQEHQLSNSLDIALKPPRDVPVDIHIKAFVGYPESRQFHVFELTRQLPRFSMYATPDPDAGPAEHLPTGGVFFTVAERVQRICLWVNQNFLLPEDLEGAGAELELQLVGLRDGGPLLLRWSPQGEAAFLTHSMQLAGDLLQSLGNFLNLDALQSRGEFPADEGRLRELADSLEGLQEARMRLDAEAAERMQAVAQLISIAEEKRSQDLPDMMQCYGELMDVNSDLMRGNEIRLLNQQHASQTLRDINVIIQRASRLRIGKYSTTMMEHCRTAIKNKNVDALVKVIRLGEA